MKNRIKFAEDYLEKVEKFDNDAFIEFIVLWLGLNALYDDKDESKRREWNKVEDYFGKNTQLIFNFLNQRNEEIQNVVDFVEDPSNHHHNLRDYLQSRRGFLTLSDEKKGVEDFAKFLYKIRCNMFHAGKLWSEEKERKLLQRVTPILKSLLKEFIEVEKQ